MSGYKYIPEKLECPGTLIEHDNGHITVVPDYAYDWKEIVDCSVVDVKHTTVYDKICPVCGERYWIDQHHYLIHEEECYDS